MNFSRCYKNGLVETLCFDPNIILFFILGYETIKVVHLPWSIQSALVSLLFIHIGYVGRKRGYFKFDSILRFIIIFVIWMVCVYVDRGRLYLVRGFFANIPVDLMGGVSGSYVIFYLSKQLEKTKYISEILKTLGRYSLVILCFHIFDQVLVPWWVVFKIINISSPQLSLIFLWGMKITWYALGILLSVKIPVLRKIFNIKET